MGFFKHFLAAACMASVALWNAPSKGADLLVFSDGPLRSALAGIVSDFRAAQVTRCKWCLALRLL